MGKAIRDFGDKLYGDNAVGLFYFSGHGTRAGDQNYLLPIGANIECADEVETRAVSAKENKMNSAKNL